MHHEGAVTTTAVPDDRPVRVEQCRLRRPAGWAIVVGALSLPALVVGALALSPDAAYKTATVLGVAGGAFACAWLVGSSGSSHSPSPSGRLSSYD
ncbi:hypothetical protein GCM10009740_15430 [Terrabacter terrae]|uniref:Uncharacterized protein n=1 Tax=Terrabacter terrae TaxID=318434 RepID=A0ABN2U2Z3_9MICO